MKYKKQPDNTVLCGMFAMYNAKVWQGEECCLSEYTESLWSTLNTDEKGICGAYLNPIILKSFKTKRVKFPKVSQVKNILNQGRSIIIRYKWVVGEKWGTHYCFLFKKGDSIYSINPHRDEKGNRPIKRKIIPYELSMMLKKAKVGNNQYPWIWPIERNNS